MVQYTLHYFNGRGRAELARWILVVAGQEYTDTRYEREQWPANKPNAPTGQVPWLQVVDGDTTVKLSQSVAIARFLARKFNLAGATDLEQAEVDMYADQVSDLLNEAVRVHFESDSTKKAEMTTKLVNETIPNNAKIFSAKLEQTKSGYLVGNGLTWADLYLVIVVEWLEDKKDAVFSSYPLLKIHYETIRSLPNIAKWLETRPATPF